MKPVLGMISVCLTLVCSFAAADVVRVDVDVPRPEVRVDENGYSHVGIPDFIVTGKPGSPALPAKAINVLIPLGHRVQSVRVEAGEKVILPGSHQIYPAQKPWVLSAGPSPFSPPDSVIYNSDTSYPDVPYRLVQVQTLRGFNFQPVVITPFQYQPTEGTISFHPVVTVVVTTEPGAAIAVRGLQRDADRVRQLVANPEMIARYAGFGPKRRGSDTRYVVVTSADLEACPGPENLQALVAEKEGRGISTGIHTVEEIYQETAGADDMEKIRNFIRDRYENHGTDFVMLVGDADLELVGGETEPVIVPVRGFWGDVNHPGEELNIPTDLYYGCLDGDFDANGNGKLGEPDDDVDLFYEVWVGRVPADSCAEVANFVRKNLAYRNAEGTWLKNVSLAGEILFPDVYAKDFLERIHYSSDENGIDTLGFSESTFFEISTMYDADLGDNGWAWPQMIDILNSDIHIMNHLGHSYTNYNLRMYTDQYISAIDNQQPFFVYGQGCFAGAFDNRTGTVETDGVVYSQDCFAEHLLLDSPGTFASVHYTRYGCVGPINMINRFFWDAAFRHGWTRLGEMHAYSLENMVGFLDDPYYRWQQYATNLFGDPELAFHMEYPTSDPILGIPTDPIQFEAVVGEQNPSAQSILVENLGEGTLNWSIAWDAYWLSVNPQSGGTAPAEVSLSVDASGLAVGEHVTELTFTSPDATNSPRALTVILNVISAPSDDSENPDDSDNSDNPDEGCGCRVGAGRAGGIPSMVVLLGLVLLTVIRRRA